MGSDAERGVNCIAILAIVKPDIFDFYGVMHHAAVAVEIWHLLLYWPSGFGWHRDVCLWHLADVDGATDQCPLSGEKQTLQTHGAMSANDPKRTRPRLGSDAGSVPFLARSPVVK